MLTPPEVMITSTLRVASRRACSRAPGLGVFLVSVFFFRDSEQI
jgi:hypothetical protein